MGVKVPSSGSCKSREWVQRRCHLSVIHLLLKAFTWVSVFEVYSQSLDRFFTVWTFRWISMCSLVQRWWQICHFSTRSPSWRSTTTPLPKASVTTDLAGKGDRCTRLGQMDKYNLWLSYGWVIKLLHHHAATVGPWSKDINPLCLSRGPMSFALRPALQQASLCKEKNFPGLWFICY